MLQSKRKAECRQNNEGSRQISSKILRTNVTLINRRRVRILYSSDISIDGCKRIDSKPKPGRIISAGTKGPDSCGIRPGACESEKKSICSRQTGVTSRLARLTDSQQQAGKFVTENFKESISVK